MPLQPLLKEIEVLLLSHWMRMFLFNSVSASLSAQSCIIISLSSNPHGVSLLSLTSHMKNVGLREAGSRIPQLSMTQTGSYLRVCFLQSPAVLTYAQHHMPELEIIYTTYTNGKDPSTDTQRDAQRDYLGTAIPEQTSLHSLHPVGNLSPHADCAPLKGNHLWFFHLGSLVCCQIREALSVGNELKSLLQSKSNAYCMGSLVSKNQWPEFHHNPHGRKKVPTPTSCPLISAY